MNSNETDSLVGAHRPVINRQTRRQLARQKRNHMDRQVETIQPLYTSGESEYRPFSFDRSDKQMFTPEQIKKRNNVRNRNKRIRKELRAR